MLLNKGDFRCKDTCRLKVRRWRNIYQANGGRKKLRIAKLIADKIHFKIKTVTRDKEVHYIITKETFQQEDITLVYLCTQHGRTQIHKAVNNKHEGNNQ